ncbi:amidase [Thermodesulfobacteriota bacterium]
MEAITRISASQLAARIRDGDLSAQQVTQAHIQRIEAVNDKLNAVVIPLFDDARAQAEEADQRQRHGQSLGPLHGVPITIKDQFHVKGLPTTFGVARLRSQIADRDGPMVAALRRAGAIILGKTNVPQTLGVVETDNAIWGRTNNPWDLTRTPGGSSGGEAAIIAACGSPLGLGADFGGSARLPAAWCGIYSIKPTARRMPQDSGPVRTASGAEGLVVQPCPMARSVADLTLALRPMVDQVVAHPTGANPPVPFREPDALDVSRLRVALLSQIGDWLPSPAIRRALQESAEALREQGATVDEMTTVPDTQEGVNLFFSIVAADGFSRVQQILGGEKPVPLMKRNVTLTSMPNAIIPVVAALLGAIGQRRLSNMMRNARRQSAAGLMNLLGARIDYERRFVAALDAGNYDAILCPALPVPAVRHRDVGNLADFWGSMLLFNTLGMPAGVAPITRVQPGEESDRSASKDKTEQTARTVEQGSAGLPVAVQVAARHWREDIVLAVMAALERHFRHQPEYPFSPDLAV